MHNKHDFGGAHISGNELFHLEKYGNRAEDRNTEIRSNFGKVITAGLGLPAEAMAESRIWRFVKDPWQFYDNRGQLLYTLENTRFSIFRVADGNFNIRCNMIMRFDWTTHWDIAKEADRREIPMLIAVKDAEGNILTDWDLGRIQIAADWVKRPLAFMRHVDAGLYSTCRDIDWHLFMFRADLYEC